MTQKQNLFITEYLKDFNATQAGIRAGFSPKSAYSIANDLLKKPEIQNAISQAVNQRQRRTEIDADYVIGNLCEIVDRCMQAAPVIIKGEQQTDENGRGVWRFDARNAVKALELLGRHLGLFTDKVKAEISAPKTLADLMLEVAGL